MSDNDVKLTEETKEQLLKRVMQEVLAEHVRDSREELVRRAHKKLLTLGIKFEPESGK